MCLQVVKWKIKTKLFQRNCSFVYFVVFLHNVYYRLYSPAEKRDIMRSGTAIAGTRDIGWKTERLGEIWDGWQPYLSPKSCPHLPYSKLHSPHKLSNHTRPLTAPSLPYPPPLPPGHFCIHHCRMWVWRMFENNVLNWVRHEKSPREDMQIVHSHAEMFYSER